MQTLHCGNVVGDQLVQITRHGVRVADATTQALVAQWRPPEPLQVNVAAASPSQVSGHVMRQGCVCILLLLSFLHARLQSDHLSYLFYRNKSASFEAIAES